MKKLVLSVAVLATTFLSPLRAMEVWDLDRSQNPGVNLPAGVVALEGTRMSVQFSPQGGNLRVSEILVQVPDGARVDQSYSSAGQPEVEYGDETFREVVLNFPEGIPLGDGGWVYLIFAGDGPVIMEGISAHVVGVRRISNRYGVVMAPVDTWVSATPPCRAQSTIDEFNVRGQLDGSTQVSWGKVCAVQGATLQLWVWHGDGWSFVTTVKKAGVITVPDSVGSIFRTMEIRKVGRCTKSVCTIAVGVSGVDPT